MTDMQQGVAENQVTCSNLSARRGRFERYRLPALYVWRPFLAYSVLRDLVKLRNLRTIAMKGLGSQRLEHDRGEYDVGDIPRYSLLTVIIVSCQSAPLPSIVVPWVGGESEIPDIKRLRMTRYDAAIAYTSESGSCLGIIYPDLSSGNRLVKSTGVKQH
ncbi:hypothetical protein BJV78DRAFT_166973 [Lactifluus subvellereus]|nr:hypothetical protein BJV78DRAFT_166973 [Lactifluus subvellereus]